MESDVFIAQKNVTFSNLGGKACSARLTQLNQGRSWGTDMVTEDDIKNALRAVKYPGYSRDVVSFGLVKHIAVSNGAVSVVMNLTGGSPEVAREIKAQSEAALRTVPGI